MVAQELLELFNYVQSVTEQVTLRAIDLLNINTVVAVLMGQLLI